MERKLQNGSDGGIDKLAVDRCDEFLKLKQVVVVKHDLLRTTQLLLRLVWVVEALGLHVLEQSFVLN